MIARDARRCCGCPSCNEQPWQRLSLLVNEAAVAATATVARAIIESVVAVAVIAAVLVVLERMERATHVVTHELFVRAAGVRRGWIDEIAVAIGEPSVDAHVHGDRGRTAAHGEWRVEAELQGRVR